MRAFLCVLGRHKWRPKPGSKIWLDWHSKFVAYEVVDGVCNRCGQEAEIRRDYYW